MMFAKKIIEDVSAKVGEAIANSPAKDVEKNVKAMLGSAFNRMDLVTREEFEIQQQVLIKTRAKLAELEARIATLESFHHINSDIETNQEAETTANQVNNTPSENSAE